MKFKESLFHDWLLPVTFPKKGESVITVSSHTMLFIAGFASRTRSRRTETKQHWSKKKKTNLNLSFECVQIYWMSLRCKINKCMHRKTEKVHRCLLKRRPGSTSEISSAAFSVRWEQQWCCTGSHRVVFTENPLKGVSTENMPLFGMKIAAQSLSLHVPTEVTESISETRRTRSRATGLRLSTAQGYNTCSVSRPGG